MLFERSWDREPMPTCHEWDATRGVFFQVLDNEEGAGQATVTFRVEDLARHVERLRAEGVEIADPVKVDGFESLWFCEFRDPEGNTVGLLEGA